jgi:hypothetical protein
LQKKEAAMDDRQAQIVDALKKGADQTLAFYHSLTPAQLHEQVYPDGARWTVLQVLAHLITIEQSMHHLFKNMLAGGPGSPPDFDFERFNRSQPLKLAGMSLAQLEERFRAVREQTVAIVAHMQDTDLDRRGHHIFLGSGNLERFVRWAYEHAELHVQDMRGALQAAEGHRRTQKGGWHEQD